MESSKRKVARHKLMQAVAVKDAFPLNPHPRRLPPATSCCEGPDKMLGLHSLEAPLCSRAHSLVI